MKKNNIKNKTFNQDTSSKEISLIDLSKVEGISPQALNVKKAGFLTPNNSEEEVVRDNNWKLFYLFEKNLKTNRIISLSAVSKENYTRKKQKRYEKNVKIYRFLGLIPTH